MLANKGDLLPVSAFPVDGTWPSGTTRWEKRAIALEIPEWDPSICIQCNKCVLVCPHAAIRAKFYPAGQLADAPAQFKSTRLPLAGMEGLALLAAGGAGRLHRLHALRGGLPGEIKNRPQTKGDQHEAHARVARAGEGQL